MKRLAGPLRPGDPVALVFPAGPPGEGGVERAVARLEELGLAVRLGAHVRERRGYLAGSDRHRAEDLAWALTDPEVRGVVCGRGGYGTGRVLPLLPWEEIRRATPRPVLGYSDITALHLALARLGWPSLHGAMPAVGEWPAYDREAVRRALMDPEPLGTLPLPPEGPPLQVLVPGVAEGVLTGGNLTLIAASLGTPWAVEAAGKILLLEDVDEEVYRLDRSLVQLRHAGVLQGVAGVAIGAFTRATAKEESLTLDAVLGDALGDLGVPVLSGLPLGHEAYRATVPLGCRVRLVARSDGGSGLTVLESPYG